MHRPLPTRRPARIAIITPVLDDWEALTHLVADLAATCAGLTLQLLIVDDGSATPLDPATLPVANTSCLERIEIITLGTNLGHQRAIAVGLVAAAQHPDLDAAIVMDCDGEDRPADILRLLAAAEQCPGTVILAARAKRHESVRFRSGYAAYKLLFRLLVGRPISFGNFCLLPIAAIRRLVYMPELWNNLPAAVLRSRMAHIAMPTERGFRYAGHSKMNLVSLVVHGLSVISVYLDTIFVRMLIASLAFAVLLIAGIIAAVTVRLTTNLVIPGWTTNAVGALAILLVQTIVLVVATTLTSLARRSSKPIIPRTDAQSFVAKSATLWQRPATAAQTPEPVTA